MKRKQFARHLNEATTRVLEFTRKFVIDELPEDCLYLIDSNASADEKAIRAYETVYPKDRMLEDSYLDPRTAQEVVDFLFRSGRVPQWVNVEVHHADVKHTYLALACCRRYVEIPDYHQWGGCPPFNCHGPTSPREWMIGETRDWSIDDCLKTFGKFKLRPPHIPSKPDAPPSGTRSLLLRITTLLSFRPKDLG